MLKSPAATSLPVEVRKRLRVPEHSEQLPQIDLTVASNLKRFHPAPTGLPHGPTALSELRPKAPPVPKALPYWMREAPRADAAATGSVSCTADAAATGVRELVHHSRGGTRLRR